MEPILIISTSLREGSHSHILARRCEKALADVGHQAVCTDAASLDLPFCDGGECYSHPGTKQFRELLLSASSVVIAMPIYNYSASAMTKSLLELGGDCWKGKVVGFLCAAGGKRSYMSPLALANSLMLDFRCVIYPQFVYGTRPEFDQGAIVAEELEQRVVDFSEGLLRMTGKLHS